MLTKAVCVATQLPAKYALGSFPTTVGEHIPEDGLLGWNRWKEYG